MMMKVKILMMILAIITAMIIMTEVICRDMMTIKIIIITMTIIIIIFTIIIIIITIIVLPSSKLLYIFNDRRICDSRNTIITIELTAITTIIIVTADYVLTNRVIFMVFITTIIDKLLLRMMMLMIMIMSAIMIAINISDRCISTTIIHLYTIRMTFYIRLICFRILMLMITTISTILIYCWWWNRNTYMIMYRWSHIIHIISFAVEVEVVDDAVVLIIVVVDIFQLCDLWDSTIIIVLVF